MSNYVQFGGDEKSQNVTEHLNELMGDKLTATSLKQCILVLAGLCDNYNKILVSSNNRLDSEKTNTDGKIIELENLIRKQNKVINKLSSDNKELSGEVNRLTDLINNTRKELSGAYDAIDKARNASELYSDEYLYIQNKQCHVSQQKLADRTGISKETIAKRIQRYSKKLNATS